MMATIRDVATLAGVSVSTVSRVLNGNYPVSTEKKEAVRRAVETLDFTPNVMGQGLSRLHSKTILIIYTAASGRFLQNSLQGIFEVTNAVGYDALMVYLPTAPASPSSVSWSRCVELLRGGLAGGVLLLGPVVADPFYQKQLEHLPAVRCGEDISLFSGNTVVYDNEYAGYDLTKRMISRGCKRFSFVLSQMPEEESPSAYTLSRKNGMLRALREAGIPYDETLTLICHQSSDVSAAYSETRTQMSFFAELPPEKRPDGIICSFDLLALACVHTLQAAGIVIPDDVAVAGFDDSEAATFCLPPLTSVRPPSREMGREAARMLIDLMEGKRENGTRVTLPHSIVERGSTLRG